MTTRNAVNSACNDIQGIVKIVSLHPDIVINDNSMLLRMSIGTTGTVSLYSAYRYMQYRYKWSLPYIDHIQIIAM